MGWTLPKDRYLLLDGGMGTLLQSAGLQPGQPPERMNLTAPDAVVAIHKAYIAAGAEVILTNTFGAANRPEPGFDIEAAVKVALACAKAARAGTRGGRWTWAPPRWSCSRSLERPTTVCPSVRSGRGGSRPLMIKPWRLLEAKAALLAAKENSDLPVLLSMTFEADGRSFAGVPVEALGVALGPMGPDGLGINCSVGPAGIMPLIERLAAVTDLPLFIKPNAGLPDPVTGRHNLPPDAFAREMAALTELPGIVMAGGCCGTTPEHIAALKATLAGKAPRPSSPRRVSRVCSATRVLELEGVHPIGERINPTGKQPLRQALKAGDLSVVQAMAAEQEHEGAAILDINVGLPGGDEVDLLPRAVKAAGRSSLPVQIDSANPAAIEAALG